MIETIIMFPLLVAFLMFIYQAYTLIHKAQIAQKYMKGTILVSTYNRYNNLKPNFYVTYAEKDKKMLYNLDETTKILLFWFLFSDEHKQEVMQRIDNFSGTQSLGICLGSGLSDGEKNARITPSIFKSMSDGATCRLK